MPPPPPPLSTELKPADPTARVEDLPVDPAIQDIRGVQSAAMEAASTPTVPTTIGELRALLASEQCPEAVKIVFDALEKIALQLGGGKKVVVVAENNRSTVSFYAPNLKALVRDATGEVKEKKAHFLSITIGVRKGELCVIQKVEFPEFSDSFRVDLVLDGLDFSGMDLSKIFGSILGGTWKGTNLTDATLPACAFADFRGANMGRTRLSDHLRWCNLEGVDLSTALPKDRNFDNRFPEWIFSRVQCGEMKVNRAKVSPSLAEGLRARSDIECNDLEVVD